jgi:CRISPR-associated protein Cmr3
MNYLVTLKPLEPFLFGGENTFGTLGDKEKGTYLVKSRMFPQQSALLGMLKKEIMTQSGVLTRKIRGEWVDKRDKQRAKELVGSEKFDIFQKEVQDFGSLHKLGALFLLNKEEAYIKKVDSDRFHYENGLLKGYNPKENIYDNFSSLSNEKKLKAEHIFQAVEQTGNKKNGGDNSLFKKTAYLLKDDFKFAFYLNVDFALSSSIVTLGADRSKFLMEVQESEESLSYADKNGYLTLLSDAYITLDDLAQHCDFAITSEISFQTLQNKKHATKQNKFQKSKKVNLYEKGSVFINPSKEFLENLNNTNCQKIGLNIYNYKQGEK